MPCDQLSNLWYELGWNFHHGLTDGIKYGLIFSYRFFLRLRFVMGQNSFHPRFIPTLWVSALSHLVFLRRRRL